MLSLRLSAEDRFAIVDMATRELAPHPSVVGNLGLTAGELHGWEPVWDLRRTGGSVYDDIVDALREGVSYEKRAPTVLVSPSHQEAVESALSLSMRGERQPRVLATRDKPLPSRRLDLTPFTDEYFGPMDAMSTEISLQEAWETAEEELRRDASTAVALGVVDEHDVYAQVDQMLAEQLSVEHAEVALDYLQAERAQLLHRFLTQIAQNSLLAQLTLVSNEGRISVVPMHGNSVHEMDCDDEILVVRPGRAGAASQWGAFRRAIAELEELLNSPEAKEKDYEALLQRNPLFLRGLNYTQVYHQVILPLGDGKSLRPDIIAEPISGEWAEVIDLKLPTEPLFSGPASRPRLSAAIAEAAAQLREYASWFDDRVIAKRVEDKYGFQCHKPKQVVIIGRDPRTFTQAQWAAAQSSYADLEIVTYDRLLKVAKDRLLF